MKVFDTLSEKDCYSSDYFRQYLLNDKVLLFNSVEINKDQIFDFIISISDTCDPTYFNCQHNQEHIGLDRIGKELTPKQCDDFVQYNWHIDNSFAENPHGQIPVIISMHMKKFECPDGLGRTLFVDRADMLRKAPEELVNWMKESFIVNLMGYDSNKYIATCYDNKRRPLRVFPLINTHPFTGSQNFLYISSLYKFFPENKEMEQLYRDYTKSYLSDKSNWMIVSWKPNMMVVWDNRSVIHSFEPGWLDGQRIFSRYQCDFDTPYYDNTF